MIKNLSQKDDDTLPSKGHVSVLCGHLGISRQGYYRHAEKEANADVLRTSIVLYCQHIRNEVMPKAGMRELYSMCQRHFGDMLTIGRDQCYEIFRSNGLIQRSRKRPRTTNSNHNYYIYPDLLNTSPKLVAKRFGELAVADITYVHTTEGWAYLSLVTDAYSRMIVGHCLHKTLQTDGPLKAMSNAMDLYSKSGVDLNGLIHHSDRGVQYCCNEYVNMLKSNGISISMTQTGDPLHNALAERMNNTIKNGWLFDCEDKDFTAVSALVDKAIDVYNNVRPHQSLAMRTPMEVSSCACHSSPI